MIEKILDDYKNLTKKIIENINKDEEVIKLMEDREEIIKKMCSYENNREQIKEILLNQDLINLDKKLKSAIEKEKNQVKEEIRSLHKLKNANNAYEKNKKINNFFSIKI
ncbi:flagellar protein FliT [Clostridium tertium]|uniref:flagellar protein FliT n=1 Tax=Clostridium tertium TaxID=1559 RepID=UPI00232D65F8|nr:flagellar protein FliT [Clostridium tertium]MDB1922510.1 flagellar protein FliT [Clostridium tertium]MDB1926273.1 flagellar protein FliT [Clostridium tertium]MDB1928867.1 flagellar protein FliT [Clostridium tertium]